MSLRVVTPPTGQPLSVTEIKTHAKIEHNDEDALIAAYIRAAVAAVDGPTGWLGRCLLTQTLELKIDRFPTAQGWIRLPCPPLQLSGSPATPAVTVTYVDDNGTTQTLLSTVYEVLNVDGWAPAEIALGYDQTWPRARSQRDAITVTYTAGYGSTASAVPADILQALKMIVAYWLNQREAGLIDPEILEVPFGYKQLLMPYKVHLF